MIKLYIYVKPFVIIQKLEEKKSILIVLIYILYLLLELYNKIRNQHE